MNSSFDPQDEELRHAEYVLGLLDLEDRRQIEQSMRTDARVAGDVEAWQRRLSPLCDAIAETAPPASVWLGIEAELGFSDTKAVFAAGSTASSVASAQAGFLSAVWENVRLWRWVGIGASLAAAAFAAVFVVSLKQAPSAAAHESYEVASIAASGGAVGWTATIDVAHSRMVVVPVTLTAVAADRSAELWLIPADGKPISLGVLASDRPMTVALPPATLPGFTVQATLAVSLEPLGGSPSGQPTGPILATGAVRGT
jgi:anti-sigma-K factor RskA